MQYNSHSIYVENWKILSLLNCYHMVKCINWPTSFSRKYVLLCSEVSGRKPYGPSNKAHITRIFLSRLTGVHLVFSQAEYAFSKYVDWSKIGKKEEGLLKSMWHHGEEQMTKVAEPNHSGWDFGSSDKFQSRHELFAFYSCDLAIIHYPRIVIPGMAGGCHPLHSRDTGQCLEILGRHRREGGVVGRGQGCRNTSYNLQDHNKEFTVQCQ